MIEIFSRPGPLQSPVEKVCAAPHTQNAEALLKDLGTDFERGLTSGRAAELQSQHGYNELVGPAPIPLWKKFLRQFQALVIWILIGAAVISGLMGEWYDTLAILAIVLLNSVLGFFQEERAERALTALQKLSAPLARVVRNGVLQLLPARELVPRDRIQLEAGDNVPADARLVGAFDLKVQEGGLTGESFPVDKDPALVLSESTPLGDRRNMAYMGTVVTAGKSSAVVVATGMAPNWVALPVCSGATGPSRLRCNAAWPSSEKSWWRSAWPSWASSLRCRYFAAGMFWRFSWFR